MSGQLERGWTTVLTPTTAAFTVLIQTTLYERTLA